MRIPWVSYDNSAEQQSIADSNWGRDTLRDSLVKAAQMAAQQKKDAADALRQKQEQDRMDKMSQAQIENYRSEASSRKAAEGRTAATTAHQARADFYAAHQKLQNMLTPGHPDYAPESAPDFAAAAGIKGFGPAQDNPDSAMPPTGTPQMPVQAQSTPPRPSIPGRPVETADNSMDNVNSEAPLPEDPNAPSIDDFQVKGGRLPRANAAASGPREVNSMGLDPEVKRILAFADQHPQDPQNIANFEALKAKGVSVDIDKFRQTGEISGTAAPQRQAGAKPVQSGGGQGARFAAGQYGDTDVKHFVDRIDQDAGKALLMDEKGQPQEVPAQALPPGAKEGSWIQNGKVVPSPPGDTNTRRAGLAAGDPGGTVNLDTGGTAPSGPTGSRLPTYKGTGPYGPITIDPNAALASREFNKKRQAQELAPFSDVPEMGNFGPAIQAAAKSGNQTLVAQLVKMASDSQDKRGLAADYKLTREDTIRHQKEMEGAAWESARNRGGNASREAPGEELNTVARYVQDHPGDQAGAIAIAKGLKDPVKAVTKLGMLPNKAANATLNDAEGNPVGQAGNVAEKSKLAKNLQMGDAFIRAAKVLRDDIAKTGNLWMPGSDYTDEGKARKQRLLDVVAFGRQTEGLPSTDFSTKLEQGGVGGSGVGPVENIRHPTISVEVLDNLIARQQESMRALQAHSLRAPTVGQPPNPLIQAGKAKASGGKRSLDDIAEEHGL